MWLEDDQVWTPALVNHPALFVLKMVDFPNRTKAETWFEHQIWRTIPQKLRARKGNLMSIARD